MTVWAVWTSCFYIRLKTCSYSHCKAFYMSELQYRMVPAIRNILSARAGRMRHRIHHVTTNRSVLSQVLSFSNSRGSKVNEHTRQETLKGCSSKLSPLYCSQHGDLIIELWNKKKETTGKKYRKLIERFHLNVYIIRHV